MNHTLDRWIQRVTLVALLALTAALLTVGVTLYASDSQADTAGGTSPPHDILTETTR
ncbi:MAG TPA: hypothetical protein VFZ09_19655 [Archangium sp.]|uniref:hypothetical protein n=1 Tax=Archangium sp. TaxID=1872627 RepID=UPI002E2EF890|nr:hypothetical protein [Archangium sp.]HEX5748464.1 hypothetical protein [Archangium sp.]